MQHPSDAAAGSIDLHSSAGACQRVASHLQLQFSTVTFLLAAVWGLILHATQSVLACIASGVCNQTAAAKAHLLLLKRSSPSRFYRTAAANASPPLTAAQQKPAAEHLQSCSTDAGVRTGRLLRSRHPSTKQQLQEAPQLTDLHSTQPCADVSCSTASTAAYASGPIARIPMQLQEHRGRLTIALDLDETLLCTYRLEHTPGCGDMLQLVPSNRASAAHKANSTSSSSGLSWSSLLSRANSFTGSSSSNTAGSYSISTTCSGLPSDLGAAARASAWMHFNTPSTPATPRRSSSSSGGSSGQGLGQPQQQQQQQQQHSPAPHTLAVFLRPGCQEFLQQLACFAEVVLFTAASPGYAAPLAQLLDPSGQLFRGRLYGDACTSHSGRRGVKDLEVGYWVYGWGVAATKVADHRC
jgi:hypothetical protein